MVIDPNVFTNEGTINVEDGGTVAIDPMTTFTNFSSNTLTGGTYEAQAGSTLLDRRRRHDHIRRRRCHSERRGLDDRGP